MAETKFILTCEHAGNIIPATYKYLFSGQEEILYSHKAIDFGALRLAQHLEKHCQLPLFYTHISRLLVEANRSPDNDQLFSSFTKNLSESEKHKILTQYYYPHRDRVEEKIKNITSAGVKVFHIAVHTFTPVLDGEVREVEIGILYHPERSFEKAISETLLHELLQQNPNRKVRFNSPYPGTTDGFPTYLRKVFPDEWYGGIELEVNQKFFLDGDSTVWDTIMQEIAHAVSALLHQK